MALVKDERMPTQKDQQRWVLKAQEAFITILIEKSLCKRQSNINNSAMLLVYRQTLLHSSCHLDLDIVYIVDLYSHSHSHFIEIYLLCHLDLHVIHIIDLESFFYVFKKHF